MLFRGEKRPFAEFARDDPFQTAFDCGDAFKSDSDGSIEQVGDHCFKIDQQDQLVPAHWFDGTSFTDEHQNPGPYNLHQSLNSELSAAQLGTFQNQLLHDVGHSRAWTPVTREDSFVQTSENGLDDVPPQIAVKHDYEEATKIEYDLSQSHGPYDIKRSSEPATLQSDTEMITDSLSTVKDIGQATSGYLSEKQYVREQASDPDAPSPAVTREVCFGVLVLNLSSLHLDDEISEYTPVTVRPFKNILTFYTKTSNQYVGMADIAALTQIVRDRMVKLDAKMPNPRFKLGRKAAQKMSKPVQDGSGSVRIAVYGCASEKATVCNLLSDAELYLQHPLPGEVDRDTEYDNPHYLIRPGSKMPLLGGFLQTYGSACVTAAEELQEVSKSQIMRVFDSSNSAISLPQIAPSSRLLTTLKEHQVTALAFMIEKESGNLHNSKFPPLWQLKDDEGMAKRYCHVVTGYTESNPRPTQGGILADEMGLGKTLSLLSLLCSSSDHFELQPRTSNTRTATLIVTPKSTIPGWCRQIERHVRADSFCVTIYHGKERLLPKAQNNPNDLVLTTHETLRADWANGGPLCTKQWFRVVLDEAHHIRNRASQVYQAACALSSIYRWCLTGTPVHNTLDDFGALLSFVGVRPFLNKSVFDSWITNPFKNDKSNGLRNLQQLVRATCLRRTKSSVDTFCKLPPREEKVESIDLSEADRDIYNFFRDRVSRLVAGGTSDHLVEETDEQNSRRSAGFNVMSMINDLRSICDHGEELLSKQSLQIWQERNSEELVDRAMLRSCERCVQCNCSVSSLARQMQGEVGAVSIKTTCQSCQSTFDGGNMGVGDAFMSPAASSAAGDDKTGYTALNERVKIPSAKIQALINNLCDHNAATMASDRPSKSVIFSVWTRMLDLVQHFLQQQGFKLQRIDGSTSLEDRAKAILEFEANPECTIMLASIGSTGEGVDFTVATDVHLMEPQWNPMVEAQAVDRVHRIGQEQSVTITRYIASNTIETYIQWVQKDKIRLVDQSINLADSCQADIDARRWEKLKAILDPVT